MTEQIPGDRRENRQLMTKWLAAIGRSELQQPLDAVAIDFSHARATDPRYNDVPQSPYRRVASRLQLEFILRAHSTGDDILSRVAMDPAVEEGCLVIAKALRYAPLGYLAFTASNARQPNIEEMGAALRPSVSAVSKFAETDRDRARIYETTFGVYPIADTEPHEPQPFVFIETPRGLRYVPSPPSLTHAESLIAAGEQSGQLQQLGAHRKCAALGAVMNGLWDRAVTICMEGPSLFPNDLSPEPVAYPANFPYNPPPRR